MVEANTAVSGTRSGSATTGSAAPTGSATTRRITDGVGRVVDSSKELVEAQAGIWSMKTVRIAAMAGFGIVGLILTVALVMYGFTLLDAALAMGLARLDMPAWFSPLVRGALYFGVPVIAMLICWHTMVGFGDPAEVEEEVNGKEAGRGVTQL
jgi:hypothetical protein